MAGQVALGLGMVARGVGRRVRVSSKHLPDEVRVPEHFAPMPTGWAGGMKIVAYQDSNVLVVDVGMS